MLRPRYRPDWTPSWLENLYLGPKRCEDYSSLQDADYEPGCIDATHIESGRLVSVKRVLTSSQELAILEHLSQTCLLVDPNNHCARIWDCFQDEDPQWTFIVIPFLCATTSLSGFDIVNDVIQIMDDALEGLVFTHAQGIAHRRISRHTLRTDESPMHPGGFHPVVHMQTPDFNGWATVLSRSTATSRVRHYYTGFGDAVRCESGAPELFKADVAALGLLLASFSRSYERTEFLASLVQDMVRGRPTAAEALEQWRTIRARISWVGRMRRLTIPENGNSWLKTVLLDVCCILSLLYMCLPAPVRWVGDALCKHFFLCVIYVTMGSVSVLIMDYIYRLVI
ncbi:hypothetical protein PsYK624_086980 [Phanerochaete sordida]|uniref:Protein kinase domain-containing protein n=1 Tax=Phanerochaete sordida TaxID=48140 RepID=A0A9P3GCU8_9APHY|nr:hypothetical protein PsYK624_086980 [Phanerochaete sordida]